MEIVHYTSCMYKRKQNIHLYFCNMQIALFFAKNIMSEIMSFYKSWDVCRLCPNGPITMNHFIFLKKNKWDIVLYLPVLLNLLLNRATTAVKVWCTCIFLILRVFFFFCSLDREQNLQKRSDLSYVLHLILNLKIIIEITKINYWQKFLKSY